MTWNKKNRQFARSCGLRPSTIELAAWINDRVDRYSTTTKLFDLKKFNQEIGKDRPKGEFNPKTVKEAMAQLDELTHGWITVVQDHHWHLKTLMVRPLDDVIFALKKKSEVRELSPRRLGGNPEFLGREREKRDLLLQQDISKLDSVFQKIHLKFGVTTLKRIWTTVGKNFDEVMRGIELMLYQNSVKPGSIKHPKAWLVQCFKDRYYQDFNLYYSPELPTFEHKPKLRQFVREIFEGVKLCPE